MPEALRHNPYVGAGGEQVRGVRVPQVMQSDPGERGFAHGAIKRGGDSVRVPRLAVGLGEDEATVRVAGAHQHPLLEQAWASGAYAWTETRRTAYGNDLTDRRTLREVTVHANETKGDLDPTQWLPTLASDVCPYVGDVVAIKARWSLTMDSVEYAKVKSLLTGQYTGTIAPFTAPPA